MSGPSTRSGQAGGAELGGAGPHTTTGAPIMASERDHLARRIGRIAAAFQAEAREGRVELALVEVRLAALAADVRSGLHDAGGGGA